MKVFRVNLASIKAGVVKAGKDSKAAVLNGFKSTKVLANDTVLLAKKSPKQVAIIAGVTVAVAAALVGAVKLIKAGIEKVIENKYNKDN